MNNDAYSPYKASRHPWITSAIQEADPNIVPAHVQLILSDLCNHSCDFCAYRTPGYSSSQLFYTTNPALAGNLARDRAHPEHNYNPKRWIPTERALALVEELSDLGVRAIQLTGGGEPTVNPAFSPVCKRIRELGMEYAVVSNGSLVGARDLYEDFAKASWVRISVDAGIARTYATTRGTKATAFAAVWDTIKAIKSHGCPVVGVGFVVTPQNWQEIAEAAQLARDAGADNIRISAMFSPEGAAVFRPFYDAAQRQCRAAKALETDRFRVFDRFGARVEDLELAAPDYNSCRYQHYTTYLGADLNVYRCCVYSYNRRGLIGSVANQSFRDLWTAQKRMDDMLAFDAMGCERCQFNNLNRFLNYICSAEDPQHANFV